MIFNLALFSSTKSKKHKAAKEDFLGILRCFSEKIVFLPENQEKLES